MMTLVERLGLVASLSAMAGHSGQGVYMLANCAEREGSSGQSRLQLTLEDASGRAVGFVWPESRQLARIPAFPSPVTVSASVRMFGTRPQLRVDAIAGIEPGEVQCATQLLPAYRCTDRVHAAFDRLARLESSLPSPLDGFLRRILLDPTLGIPFLTCRASVRHHHAYRGGLLVHSTEMLDLVDETTRRVLPDDPWAPHIAQLGYLLHDVGKLRSVGECRRPAYGLVVRHEIMTIEMLAPHLQWLEQRSPELAVGLRSIFDYLATPYAARRIPPFAAAEIVATMDQWSAAAHSHKDLGHLLGSSGVTARQRHRGSDALAVPILVGDVSMRYAS